MMAQTPYANITLNVSIQQLTRQEEGYVEGREKCSQLLS